MYIFKCNVHYIMARNILLLLFIRFYCLLYCKNNICVKKVEIESIIKSAKHFVKKSIVLFLSNRRANILTGFRVTSALSLVECTYRFWIKPPPALKL